MKPLLGNPVYHSLLFNDSHLGYSAGHVRWFHEEVSPFAGFEEGYKNGFAELYELLPAGRKILYATPLSIAPPKGWQLLAAVNGLQFVFEGKKISEAPSFHPARLQPKHVDQMMALATLTEPGPFGRRTIEFGHYYGVFDEDKLVAMTGQRLHVQNFTEVSAVCSHPGYLGRGYATALVQHQMNLILSQGQIPFLHVRADNERAIAIYKRLGFAVQGEMNFYFWRSRRTTTRDRVYFFCTFTSSESFCCNDYQPVLPTRPPQTICQDHLPISGRLYHSEVETSLCCCRS
jgi:ribosomal protein S18 acetylase RimI-like enzyme